MKSIALLVALFVVANSPVLAEIEEQSQVMIKTRLDTQNASIKSTIIFSLEPGTEKIFGRKFPKFKILALPLEAEQVPLQISLVAENGQVLSSTTVYYRPETGAEFSLDADGIDAEGRVSRFGQPKPD